MSYPTLSEFFTEAQRVIKARKELGGIEFPTGLNFLDELTGGIKRGEIWVVSGKTGAGKTALAMQLLRNFADNPTHSVLAFSLELKGWQLALRSFCEMNGINYSDLENGRIEFDPIQIKSFEMFIEGIDYEIIEGGYTFAEIEKVIETYYTNKKPDVIVLDFIQLIEWKNFKDERIAIMEYMRKIKELANKLNISFLIVSQIRRLPSGADYNRAPDLQDLMGSGSLEQMADKVIFLYKTFTEGEIPAMDETKYFINLAKNRQGRTDCQEVIYHGESYRFADIT